MFGLDIEKQQEKVMGGSIQTEKGERGSRAKVNGRKGPPIGGFSSIGVGGDA